MHVKEVDRRVPHTASSSALVCLLPGHLLVLLLQLLCLDVHPSRPTLAATGGSAGTVAIWDLRFQAAPLALTGARPASGDVCQVRVHVARMCWHQVLCRRVAGVSSCYAFSPCSHSWDFA